MGTDRLIERYFGRGNYKARLFADLVLGRGVWRGGESEPGALGIIIGGRKFRVTGRNVYVSREGESLKLQDGKGRLFDIAYDKIESPQRVEGHLVEPPEESGTCKLILTTFGGDESEDAKLGIYERVVSFVKFEEVTAITNVHGVFDTNVDKVTMGNEVEIVGTKLDAGDVKVKWLDEGEPKSLTLSDGFIGSREADKIVTTENWWPSTTIAAGAEVTFEVNGVEHGGVLVQG